MYALFFIFSFLSSFSSAQDFEAPICITVYTGDVTFARVALEAAAEQKGLFNIDTFKLERTSGDVVIYIKGSDAGAAKIDLEVRMKQDCGTGEAVVLSITGPTVLI